MIRVDVFKNQLQSVAENLDKTHLKKQLIYFEKTFIQNVIFSVQICVAKFVHKTKLHAEVFQNFIIAFLHYLCLFEPSLQLSIDTNKNHTFGSRFPRQR